MQQLMFGVGNTKLSAEIATFSLPAGWACPGAKDCLARANRQTGRLTDGPNTKFRCYAASMETVCTSVRHSRWNNFELLKGKSRAEMTAMLIERVNAIKQGIVRIHVSGDYFSQDYFDAWLDVARAFPLKTFYGYTKSLLFWVRRIKDISPNLRLTASRGGRFDDLIDQYNLVSAEVVYSEWDAKFKRLEIDHDDSLAIRADKSFAILLHGTQKAGTQAAEDWRRIQNSDGGYSRRAKQKTV